MANIDAVLGAASFNATTRFGVDTSSGNFDYNSDINGVQGITKYGLNRLTLGGNNAYAGITTITDGALRITSNNALGDTAGNTVIAGGPDAGTPVAVLELIGGVSTPENIVITGKSGGNNASPSINNISGDNAITGDVSFAAAGTWYNIQSDAGKLTLTGINNSITRPRTATARRGRR